MRIHHQFCQWCQADHNHVSHRGCCRCENCGRTATEAWIANETVFVLAIGFVLAVAAVCLTCFVR